MCSSDLALTVQLVLDAVPQEPPMRITLVGVSGGLLPSVVAQLGGRMPGELTCIDGDRATLSAVESAVNARSGGLRVRLVQEDLVRLCLGGSPLRLAPQHVVVVDGLLEYLPERVAASAARWAHGQLAPGGCALFSSLQPAADEALFRYVLAWPTVRRTPGATTRMLQEAGFADVRVYEAGGVGAVAVAR